MSFSPNTNDSHELTETVLSSYEKLYDSNDFLVARNYGTSFSSYLS